jgi:hypothetical protein
VIDAALRTLVRQRAGDRCEYCHLELVEHHPLVFHIEHITARQDIEENR